MRRMFALLSFSLIATAALAPAHAETGAAMKPALTINYTQKGVDPEKMVRTLVSEVQKIDPNATYDVIGYETTPKNDFWPVSTRVKQVQEFLLRNGVAREKTYLLVKPTDTPYQKIDIYVHN